MTTIAAGTNPTITLPAGQVMQFDSGGAGLATVMRVGAMAPLKQQLVGISPVTLGPYGFDHQVCITCERALSYSFLTGNMTLTPAQQDSLKKSSSVIAMTRYQIRGTDVAPASGAPINSVGVLGGPVPMLMRGLQVGSIIKLENISFLRTGSAGNLNIDIRLGSVNGLSATILSSQAFGTASTTPKFTGTITIESATTASIEGCWTRGTAGLDVIDVEAVALGFDVTANDAFLVFACNTITSPDTVALIRGDVYPFQ